MLVIVEISGIFPIEVGLTEAALIFLKEGKVNSAVLRVTFRAYFY
jgi:hypothetical protein